MHNVIQTIENKMKAKIWQKRKWQKGNTIHSANKFRNKYKILEDSSDFNQKKIIMTTL